MKASFEEVPTLIVNCGLVVDRASRVRATRVYPAPGFSILSPENVATPLTADAVVVPSRTPEPGLALIASVIVFVAVVILVPEALCTST